MATLLFAMMAITAVDVIGRYVFSKPVYGGYEIVQFMMALVVFCSLPIATRHDSHLTVSVLTGQLRGGAAHAHRLFVLSFSLAGAMVIAWRTWVQADILVSSKQISGLLEWPLGPLAYAMAVFAWLTVAILVGLLIAALRGRDVTPPRAAPAID
jgi:TRAP-type C4-dicarboxylate transport system permease small subunit